jgi:chromosome segregation ATPase
MSGFKSFGNRITAVHLTSGFTYLLGPPGSGKSNFIDALCFCLGQNDYLAGDLLFSGTTKLKRAKQATVAIEFSFVNPDEPSGIGDFTIVRTIHRKGVETYAISGAEMTREDFLSHLASSNIYHNGYNIVQEGKISEYIQMNDIARRHAIEALLNFENFDEIERARVFSEAFVEINQFFTSIFPKLSPGEYANLVLELPDDPLGGGVVVEVQTRDQKVSSLQILSPNEKTLVALAFFFAIYSFKPAPFCALDAIDAELDESSAHRVGLFLQEFAVNSQFLVASRRTEFALYANRIFGFSKEDGITNIFSITLEPDIKFCPICGGKINTMAEYCDHCGQQLRRQ